jgi:hypothetical protein
MICVSISKEIMIMIYFGGIRRGDKRIFHPMLLCFVLLIYLIPLRCSADSNDNWGMSLIPYGKCIADARIGVSNGPNIGYNGQTQYDLTGKSGKAIALYREYGDNWAGETGFYYADYELPIVAGESKTWWNIYLWAQNYTTSGNTDVIIGTVTAAVPPQGYVGHLVIDYMPDYLNYTGDRAFDIDLHKGKVISLPVPTVTNPLDGIRMHLTVTAPLPEPSSLAALGFGVLPVAGVALRRRRRK